MAVTVQLVHPRDDKWYGGFYIQSHFGPPIGLAVIAKAIKSAIKDVTVQIFDGNVTPLNEILERIGADFVGVSDWYSNHLNALRILEQAKARGATTIIGGHNVNYLAERILANNPFVDFAVAGDGENSIPFLIAGKKPAEIPNLVYRDGGRIIRNRREESDLDILFDLDGLEKLNCGPGRPFPLSSIRGCVKAEKEGRCAFCSIDHKLKIMNPDFFWRQVKLLFEKYGMDYFFETGDSFVVGDYPERLLAARPKELSKIKLRCYARPDQLNEKNAKILKKLNMKEIYLGVESINDNVLRNAGKSYSKKDIKKAVRLLEKNRICFMVPFLYGLPGETRKTAAETLAFAKKLVKRHPKMKIIAGIVVPLPGTELFENIKRNKKALAGYPGDLGKDDFFDYKKLVQIHTKYFTSLTYEELRDFVEKTSALVGWNKNRVVAFGTNK
ncbi:MAG: radical SAM protein [Candidatus Diapherotrites archaeon]|nr:radical SAM protein [Candidatus Diapherotrites archaeon]